ncbi:MAG: hypothetical protein AAFO03_11180 [Bacteroidota bacterium]
MDRRTFNRISYRAVGLSVFSSISLAACLDDDSTVLPQEPQLRWNMTFAAQQPAGGLLNLQWQSLEVELVDILLVADDQSTTLLTTQTPAEDQFCRCALPENLEGIYRVRITNTVDPTLNAISPPFAVVPALALDLVDTPAVGELRTVAIPSLGEVSINRITEDQIEVLDLGCPGDVCTVVYSADSESFECPCNGSTFTKRGCLTGGPAQEGLGKFTSWYYPQDNLLLLSPGTRTPAC